MMKDSCTYLIQLHGQVTESEINGLGPLQMTVTHTEANGTRLTLFADQSGLIGLLRYLHGMGYVFLSVERIQTSQGT